MSRKGVRSMARAAIERGQPLDWFEELYTEASTAGVSAIPWADLKPNPNLLGWLDREGTGVIGKSALVVGCGLGDDAEELARRGFDVTAFDISRSAVAMALRRFPTSAVNYAVADLFRPPAGWNESFDFVQEAYTLQVLPVEMRYRAVEKISSFVAPGGTLLVIARGRDDDQEVGELPWPLTRAEVRLSLKFGLEQFSFEDYLDSEVPAVRRFRATFRRGSAVESHE